VDGLRPCPWSCRHNLTIEVTEAGTVRELAPPGGESCVLDIADRGGLDAREVGNLLNVSRQAVQQVETVALIKLRRHPRLRLR
jgi:hypothetical protein